MVELCFPTSLAFPWADFSHQTITTPGAGSASSFGLHQDTITALIICLAILFLVTLVTVFLFIRACRRRRSRVADMSVRIVRESDMDEGGWNNAYGYGLSGGASRAVSPYSVGAGSTHPGGGPVSPRSSTCWTGSEEQHEEGKSGTYSTVVCMSFCAFARGKVVCSSQTSCHATQPSPCEIPPASLLLRSRINAYALPQRSHRHPLDPHRPQGLKLSRLYYLAGYVTTQLAVAIKHAFRLAMAPKLASTSFPFGKMSSSKLG